jgi:hypothetical protein
LIINEFQRWWTGRDSTFDNYCSPLRIAQFLEAIKTIENIPAETFDYYS